MCAALAACTSAAATPPRPSASGDALLPTEAERAWELTGFPADQRPQVDPIRVVSIFEQPEATAACLRAAGYPRAVVVNGRVEPGEVAEAQLPSLTLSTYLCEAQYPADPLFDRPLSPDQVRTLYRYRSTEQRECLQGLGHAIAVPPTERAFVDGYAEHGGWNPMNSVPAFGFAGAEAACPALPAELSER
ncbi:hypothetical protein [Agromyces silvae]|uniref:hypothetical protein n=1 Tax=Agromyces silvae TaxID=3388266 RepID=UPI00280BCBD2|nr:hypothetical protein [Agromyces protaetiae]